MARTWPLAAGGAIATAVAFGPARVGFGLFLPRFREQFDLSTSGAGLIASGAFAGFFFALLLTAWLVVQRGPRLAVALGGFAALGGMVIVAISQNTAMLAVGTVLAATSAGFCWSPFNNAAERGVPSTQRERALSVISTGTAAGIVGAGILALAVARLDQGWRTVWVIFSFAALLAATVNLYALARLPHAAAQKSRHGWLKQMVAKPSWPLLAIALSFGFTNGFYLSFAVDHVSQAGGLPGVAAELSGPVLYIAVGIGGAIGFLTADIKSRIGLTALVRGIFVCSLLSLVLLGLLPTRWAALLASAALQGACIMVLSAIFSFWSSHLHPALPTIGFTATLAMFAAGNILGPAISGLAAGALGLAGTFVANAVISLATILLFPGKKRREALGDHTT
ncbi:major facilitator superfamily transporter [Salinisphaera dokdonensis CL-ES53]|uniref:Major facilitator superfamily transporter n=1 Tax=Salinisphaera dokdonensis CL-ES53 TaxID=1304272 RepID=A0ABV2B0H3_9GAMM